MLPFLALVIEPLHIICFYILFFTQNWKHLKNLRVNKFVKMSIAIVVMVLIQFSIESGFFSIQWLSILCTNLATILFLIIITYLSLRQHDSSDLTLRIGILLSMNIFITIQIFGAFLDRFLVIMCQNIKVVHPMLIVIIIHNMIEALLSILLGIISASLYNFNRIVNKKINRYVYYIVIGMFSSVYVLTLFFTLSEKLSDYVVNLLLFLIIQLIIFWIVYFLINLREKQLIHNELVENRLSNLKEYTEYLEQEQRKLRKFKHDYQNMILSLEENLRSSNLQGAKDYLKTFKQYSSSRIMGSELWLFNDFDNIKFPYLKSILIQKTSQAAEQGIKVHFECKYNVECVAMESYDLVRIIGITYDNAIEAVHDFDKDHKKINIMVYRTDGQTEIAIANPVLKSKNLAQIKKEGITTKKGHSGFGLANIDEISNNYSNLLVNYQEVKGWFTVQFVIMDKQDSKKKKRKK